MDELSERIIPVGSAKALKFPGIKQDWRIDFWQGCLQACQPEAKGAVLKLAWKNRHFVKKVVGASLGTASGGVGVHVVAGTDCVIAGTALTATGILAPVGVALLVGGIVGSVLGVGATAGGAASMKAALAEKEELNSLTETDL